MKNKYGEKPLLSFIRLNYNLVETGYSILVAYRYL